MADLSWHFDGSKRRTAKIVLFVQTREVCMDINVSSGFVFLFSDLSTFNGLLADSGFVL